MESGKLGSDGGDRLKESGDLGSGRGKDRSESGRRRIESGVDASESGGPGWYAFRYTQTAEAPMFASSVIHRDPEIPGGTLVFVGTRVPAKEAPC